VAVRVFNPNRLLPNRVAGQAAVGGPSRLPARVERPGHRKPLHRAQAAASAGPPPRARDAPSTAGQEPSAAAAILAVGRRTEAVYAARRPARPLVRRWIRRPPRSQGPLPATLLCRVKYAAAIVRRRRG
jgi:hypothetical protein